MTFSKSEIEQGYMDMGEINLFICNEFLLAEHIDLIHVENKYKGDNQYELQNKIILK